MKHDPYDGQTRGEYLQSIADEYGADLQVVLLLADLLGPNEDFDGLLTELEDFTALDCYQ